MSAAEAVRLIRDGDTVATGDSWASGLLKEIAIALEELYLSAEAGPPYGTGKPRYPHPRLCGRSGRREGSRA